MNSGRGSERLGAAALLLAATLWGILWYPLRWLESHGLPGLWATALIYVASSVVGVILAWPVRRHVLAGWRVAVIALAAGWCNAAFIQAVIHGEVMRVMLLFYLAPVWTILLARLWLGEALDRGALVSVLLGITGVFLMLWQPGQWPWPAGTPDWWALGAGAAFAVANVTTRGLPAVPVRVKTAVTWWGCLAVSVTWLGIEAPALPQPTLGALLVAVALGAAAMTVMTLAVQYGVSHLPARRSAMILLFELVVAGVSAAWLAGEHLLPREWLGGVLIAYGAWRASRAG